MRENKLRHTFADQLGEAQESDELNSKKEARKLAFYLFWNVRPDYDRCCKPSRPLPCMAIWLLPSCCVNSVSAVTIITTRVFAEYGCRTMLLHTCDLSVALCKRPARIQLLAGVHGERERIRDATPARDPSAAVSCRPCKSC